jgi:ubiquinone/menaquinone biosynthesis C-methylase UbiE
MSKRNESSRRAWQLPRGVSSGTWDYLAEPSIATEYDSFHGDHPLMRLDVQIVTEELQRLCAARGVPASELLLADFGCGTARVARQLKSTGCRMLNVDLSMHMLQTASSAVGAGQSAAYVHSNLVELDWLADGTIDLSVCLFSSIGMIRGRQHRIAFLKHVQRTLKPDGRLVLHVHNRGHSWFDPQGPGWLINTWLKSKLNKSWEFGDRVYVYRGLPQMFLHIYSRRELLAELRAAGFKNVQLRPINLQGSDYLESIFNQYWRAGGYFAICGDQG